MCWSSMLATTRPISSGPSRTSPRARSEVHSKQGDCRAGCRVPHSNFFWLSGAVDEPTLSGALVPQALPSLRTIPLRHFLLSARTTLLATSANHPTQTNGRLEWGTLLFTSHWSCPITQIGGERSGTLASDS